MLSSEKILKFTKFLNVILTGYSVNGDTSEKNEL